MIVAVGIDVVLVEPFARALERTPLLGDRLFTAGQRLTVSGNPRSPESLAARFAAKEAVAKALGLEVWSFADVEVVAARAGPEVRLGGAAADRARALGVRAAVSLTHTRAMAGAAAVLEPA